MEHYPKILFTGPECTGKTTASKMLAERLKAIRIPELAVEYLERIQRPYELKDLCTLAQMQVLVEDKISKQDLCICDTSLLVLDIWMRVKFDDDLASQGFELTEHMRGFQNIFLCAPDFPWVDGPFREQPENPIALFHKYEQRLKEMECNYQILQGDTKARAEQMAEVLDIAL